MNPVIAEIRELIRSARMAVVHSVDLIQVLTNFEIGRRIVEHEQKGAERAEYGKALIKELSAELTAEFGRGFSRSNLQNMRKFFLTYADRLPEKCQIPSGKLLLSEQSQTPSGELATTRSLLVILQTSSAKSAVPQNANNHVREYQLYLPDKELLRRKLEEWGQGVGGREEEGE